MRQPWIASLLFSVLLVVGLGGAVTIAIWSSLLAFKSENPFATSAANYYRNAIPPEIGTAELVGYGSMFQADCGGFAFRLTENAAKEIQQIGLAKLQEARTSLAYNGSEKISYKPWQATPLPDSWLGDGRWAIGMGCFVDNDQQFKNNIVYDAVKEPGNFYTSSESKTLVIFLKQRLVVGTYMR